MAIKSSPKSAAKKKSAAKTPKLRIATWNINSVRARLGLVETFCAAHRPDVLCLQETKAANGDFPADRLRALGYRYQVLHGQKMHHGVAVLSKIETYADTRQDWQGNGEARHAGVMLRGVTMGGEPVRIENIYAPAGGDIPDIAQNPKFGLKLAYFDRLIEWAAKLKQNTIMLGDLNIAPHPDDVWSHKDLLDVVSHTPIECEKMLALQAAHDFVDVSRQFVPLPEKLFTWWSYRAADWQASNRGRRLDHIWVSPALKNNIIDTSIITDTRNWERPSDHAPVIADFALDEAPKSA